MSPAEPTLSDRQATQKAIEFGAAIVQGTVENDRIHYGGGLYIAAAEHLDHTPCCPACGDESAGCASRTLKRMQGTAHAAAQFLEQITAADDVHRHGLTHHRKGCSYQLAAWLQPLDAFMQWFMSRHRRGFCAKASAPARA